MGFTSERLEQAINILRERGHVIPTYPQSQLAAVGPDGLMILIDASFTPSTKFTKWPRTRQKMHNPRKAAILNLCLIAPMLFFNRCFLRPSKSRPEN
jgi:hypothetical protein